MVPALVVGPEAFEKARQGAGAVAELERAKIIERTTRGRLHRLRMGR